MHSEQQARFRARVEGLQVPWNEALQTSVSTAGAAGDLLSPVQGPHWVVSGICIAAGTTLVVQPPPGAGDSPVLVVTGDVCVEQGGTIEFHGNATMEVYGTLSTMEPGNCNCPSGLSPLAGRAQDRASDRNRPNVLAVGLAGGPGPPGNPGAGGSNGGPGGTGGAGGRGVDGGAAPKILLKVSRITGAQLVVAAQGGQGGDGGQGGKGGQGGSGGPGGQGPGGNGGAGGDGGSGGAGGEVIVMYVSVDPQTQLVANVERGAGGSCGPGGGVGQGMGGNPTPGASGKPGVAGEPGTVVFTQAT